MIEQSSDLDAGTVTLSETVLHGLDEVAPTETVAAEAPFHELQDANYRRTDRLFAILMVGQLVLGSILALFVSPHLWAGPDRSVHAHVWIALALGALVSSVPIVLVLTRPGQPVTRNVVAISQVLWSSLLIQITAGRIETHFHVFCSLAFLALYRDWRILVLATIVVAADHLLRQMFWPESVYGVVDPGWWRSLEHVGWIMLEAAVLIVSCIHSERDMREVAQYSAEAEASKTTLLRNEKLAALGQLAASVGHELRNPLAAVRSAATYVAKRTNDGQAADPRVPQFLDMIDRELTVCAKIIADLLDFARERPLDLASCPLRALVDEAIALIPNRAVVELLNEIPDDLPVPELDRDQFRQVIVNLVQNAIEATAQTAQRLVVVTGVPHGKGIRISVSDNGPGMPKETLDQIFEPLFSTKTKGTGLGLAIVHNVVRDHGAEIVVDSVVGTGTTFHIDIDIATTSQTTTA